MSHSDADALPHLVDVMHAAGAHNRTQVITSAEAALNVLSAHRAHKARTDILDILEAAQNEDWTLCWGRAWQATCGLTNAFPPDIALCPPAPTAVPHRASNCGTCNTPMSPGARFCAICGTPTTV